MEALKTVELTDLTSDLLIAKMVQSKKDGRLAFIQKINGDRVILDMERIGERNFPIDLVNKNFKFLTTNKEVVKAFFFNNYSVRHLFNPKSLYETAFSIHDRLCDRIDLSNVETAEILKDVVEEVNRKSGL